MQPYDVVRVIAIRDDRFNGKHEHFERNPRIGDTGTILEAYSAPEPAFEIECVNPADGITIWLEALYPDEVELAQKYP
jgi:hypothetical protein